jgi:phenylpropionate dioxygenase-like ring-hydroxylating dioxygenase large terminal subunit
VYHQGWYPLAMSGELKGGALMGRDFLGGRVILYRGAGGAPVVQSAFCPHLGADLSAGEIVDGQVRCAFHHWCFDAAGACTRIPTERKIPPGARIFTYPSAEAWGLVWAFTGPEPLFDLPYIPRAQESELVYRTRSSGVVPYEPWVPVSNGIDFQHLRSLHGLSISEPDTIDVRGHHIEYTLREENKQRHGLITGTNTFSLYRNDNGHETFALFSGTPLGPGETLAYYVVGVRDTHPRTEEERQAVERHLDAIGALTARLLEEDEKVLSSCRFRKGVLVGADRHLARYFKYVREFPCASFVDAC